MNRLSALLPLLVACSVTGTSPKAPPPAPPRIPEGAARRCEGAGIRVATIVTPEVVVKSYLTNHRPISIPTNCAISNAHSTL